MGSRTRDNIGDDEDDKNVIDNIYMRDMIIFVANVPPERDDEEF